MTPTGLLFKFLMIILPVLGLTLLSLIIIICGLLLINWLITIITSKPEEKNKENDDNDSKQS